MIQELVYTSSQKGLKLGSSGFCTVGSSTGMAQNMALFLESLSGYRHLFEPKNPANPVVYSHLKQKLGGVEYSILSRIADAGLDYSNRSNKIAHHVAVSKSERGNSSPGVLLANDFMIGQWTSTARQLPPRGTPNIAPLPMRSCKLWDATCGDSGWGGALVDAWKSKRVTYVVIEPNTNAIGLVQESLSLLPVHEQWDVSFSTFFTRLPPKVECDWRFVIAGSQEATTARRTKGALIVDTTRQSTALNSRYAAAARTGKLPAGSGPETGSGTKASRIPSKMENGIDLLDDDLPLVDQEYKAGPVSIRGRGKAKAVPPGMGREAISSTTPDSVIDYANIPAVPKSKRTTRGIWITAAISLLILVGTSVGIVLGMSHYYNGKLIEELNVQIELESQVASLADATEAFEKRKNELRAEKKTLEDLIAKRDTDLKNARGQISNFTTENVSLKENVKSVQKERQIKVDENLELQKQLSSLKNKIQKIQKKAGTITPLNIAIENEMQVVAIVRDPIEELKIHLPKKRNSVAKNLKFVAGKKTNERWPFRISDPKFNFNITQEKDILFIDQLRRDLPASILYSKLEIKTGFTSESFLTHGIQVIDKPIDIDTDCKRDIRSDVWDVISELKTSLTISSSIEELPEGDPKNVGITFAFGVQSTPEFEVKGFKKLIEDKKSSLIQLKDTQEKYFNNARSTTLGAAIPDSPSAAISNLEIQLALEKKTYVNADKKVKTAVNARNFIVVSVNFTGDEFEPAVQIPLNFIEPQGLKRLEQQVGQNEEKIKQLRLN